MSPAPASDPGSALARVPLSAPPRRWSAEALVGPGALDRLPRLLRNRFSGFRVAAVADARALHFHAARLQAALPPESTVVEVPSGEEHKTRAEKERVENELLRRRMGRDTVVVGFGGGVVTDLAGFVAATYLRGVPYVGAPTTLLGAVDASVGGKTGVNTGWGKNLIGAYHQPAAILVDTEVLGTLPNAEFRDGLAEAFKMAATSDADAFESFEDDLAALSRRETAEVTRLITGSIRMKGAVVGADEREGGLREVLNFGHTVAHGLERASDYRLSHGAAVAVGIVAECRIAHSEGALGRRDEQRVVALFAAAGLPTRAPAGLSRSGVLEAMGSDKKARQGRLRFVLLEEIGRVRTRGEGAARRFAFPVSDEALDAGLARIGL